MGPVAEGSQQDLAGRRPSLAGRLLVCLEWFTGLLGVIGGLALVARADGSMLGAGLPDLAGSPFTSWRLPGMLLAVLVGVGFLAIGTWQWIGGRWARELSIAAGVALVIFEVFVLAWLGFQPLEVVFGIVGVAVVVLGWRLPHAPTVEPP
ncbi:hypothetical protein [Rhodococcus sp. X156]|uniref:hypothetical protein n=1 Tax=Rhodococcus sp. X156 TaxID=2499145 RepID=UPI000FDA8877|nr:hypothetical protein [Rhodococcus sp. X156]